MEDVVDPWHGRRVFLTGHTGFKGGWLSLWLASHGATIRGYALAPSTEPNLFTAGSVRDHLDDVRGDTRDYAKLEAAMTGFAPEVVFHLAAQPLVRRSYADPLVTYATNIMGTANVMEAIRKTPSVRAVVCITSDKCYENQEWVWPYRETDPLGGYDPYSASKACAEIVIAACRNSYFPPHRLSEHHVRIATTRAGNVIGGGDWSADRLIPDLVRGFQSKKPMLIRQPHAIRPWQHVLEPLHGYIMLAERLLAAGVESSHSFNFGPGDEEPWSVERIANKLAALWGDGATWTIDSVPEMHEAHLLRLDSSRANTELGWRPRLGIERALEWTLDWYRGWQQGADMQQVTLDQVSKFESLGSQA